MKIPSKDSALSVLMGAAMALPIVGLSPSTQAEEIVPPVLPVGASMGMRVLYYREAHQRMTVKEPVIWLKSPVGEDWELSLSGTVDIVSGASPIIVSNLTGPVAQIMTGASITDRRRAGDVAVKRKIGDGTLGVSHTESTEKDYISRATGVNASWDFNDRNTTLALGHGLSNDRVKSVTDARLNERRDTREYMIGITQLLDRNALVQSNLVSTRGRGYLSDPYKLTYSLSTLPPPVALVRDLRPASRDEWAWLTRYKRNLPTQGAVVTTEYRYFRDDWGVRAHTVFASWLQAAGDRWKWEAGLRYYSQSGADFYRAEIPQRPVPRYTSSDQRLASYGALEPSFKVIYQLTDGTAVDLGLSVYRQQGGWKFGGSGSPAFEPLQAVMVNAGIVHRF
jgi:hypothetical protein